MKKMMANPKKICVTNGMTVFSELISRLIVRYGEEALMEEREGYCAFA